MKGDVRTRDDKKINKSGERQLCRTGQGFNVINDTVSMLRGRRYQSSDWMDFRNARKKIFISRIGNDIFEREG